MRQAIIPFKSKKIKFGIIENIVALSNIKSPAPPINIKGYANEITGIISILNKNENKEALPKASTKIGVETICAIKHGASKLAKILGKNLVK